MMGVMMISLFLWHVDVVGHDQVVGALHEAGEFCFGVVAEQVGTPLGDEDIILASGYWLLNEEELVAGIYDHGMITLHS